MSETQDSTATLNQTTSTEDTKEECKDSNLVELTKDGGVVKQILQEGSGPKPSTGEQVEVHYRGTLEDGTEFDCSYNREPLQFKVGTGMVIKGWDLGILSMKTGEKARLTIKSEYGYGKSGSPPTIPGGATLIFDVELVSVGEKTEGEGSENDDFADLTDEQRLEKAMKCKAEGNELFKKNDLFNALAKYREAIMDLEDLEDANKPEAKDAVKLLQLNIATVTKKMEKWPEVVKATTAALEIDPANVKALFFRGTANRHLKEFDTALEDLKAAIKLNPNDKAMRTEFAAIKEAKKKHLATEKGIFEKAFSGGLYEEKKDVVKKESYNEPPKYNPENPKVFMDIKIGEKEPQKVIFELFQKNTPETAENFRCLCTGEKKTEAKSYHYKGNKFHRIIKDFMAQGGDIDKGNGTGGYSIYGRKFDDEQVWIPHSEKGLLSMANSGPNTNGSQFFITFVETPHLNGKHTVFGRVIKGWNVVKEMEAVETGASDVPVDPVEIVDWGEYTETLEESELDLNKE